MDGLGVLLVRGYYYSTIDVEHMPEATLTMNSS